MRQGEACLLLVAEATVVYIVSDQPVRLSQTNQDRQKECSHFELQDNGALVYQLCMPTALKERGDKREQD